MTRCIKLLLLPLRVLASVAFLPIVFFTSRLGLFTGLALLADPGWRARPLRPAARIASVARAGRAGRRRPGVPPDSCAGSTVRCAGPGPRRPGTRTPNLRDAPRTQCPGRSYGRCWIASAGWQGATPIPWRPTPGARLATRGRLARSPRRVVTASLRRTPVPTSWEPDSAARTCHARQGRLIAGSPVRLALAVKMSPTYNCSGSSDRSPSLNAVVGVVGIAIASTRSNAVS